MPAKPPLPDDYELPAAVNGWYHDPESNRNGHVWTAADAPKSVGVFCSMGDEVRVHVFDDRVDGFQNKTDICRLAVDGPEPAAVADGIDRAIAWMRSSAPAEWSHPDVCEAVFDAPVGYSLERYYLENRETTVYYRRDGAEKQVGIDVRCDGADALTADEAPYLYIHVWNGSGSATVAIAPWLRAHGPGSKHWDVREIAETPEDCGLEVAVSVARQWALERTDEAIDTDAAGQADLGRWSA